MAGQIMRPHVSFRLDNFPRKIPASCPPDQNFTDKVSGNLECGSLEKLPFEFHDECEGSEGGFPK
jgi:hypothetical protein